MEYKRNIVGSGNMSNGKMYIYIYIWRERERDI